MKTIAQERTILRSMKSLHGFTIGATDGDIGTVDEFYFDDTSYTVRYVVVDTGGWLSGRKVLLSPIALGAIDWDHKRISAALTKSQVENSPGVDTEKPVSRQHETAYTTYYGYAPYWTGDFLWGAYPYPFPGSGAPGSGPALSAAELENERRWNWETNEHHDRNLRSSRAVTGYHIQAKDGEIGHVEDFLVDNHTWTIRYMIVDTTNWWPGKQVLVAPEWIQHVDWDHSKVEVTVDRARIKDGPEYDPTRPVEREYETQMYGHHGQPHYWGKYRGAGKDYR